MWLYTFFFLQIIQDTYKEVSCEEKPRELEGMNFDFTGAWKYIPP